MKRTLLQGFDPLPKSLSTKGLLALVGVVVLGTAVTVQRYVESSQGPAHRGGNHTLFERPSEVRAAPREDSGGAWRAQGSSHEYGAPTTTRSRSWSGSCGDRPCPRTESETTGSVGATAPSAFRPDGGAQGS